VAGCASLTRFAAGRGVRLAFEPEPGMLVESLADWERLVAAVGPGLDLTLDIGHCRCLEPVPEADCVRRAGSRLANVQLDDMRRGVHEHLPFGEGEVDLPAVLGALRDTGYRGLSSVELPRHSHAGPEYAARSLTALRAAEAAAPPAPLRAAPDAGPADPLRAAEAAAPADPLRAAVPGSTAGVAGHARGGAGPGDRGAGPGDPVGGQVAPAVGGAVTAAQGGAR
jgi:hypothetical protein